MIDCKLDARFGCHVWTGKLGSNGRPIVWLGKTPVNAYRLSYKRRYGFVRPEDVIDHVCRNLRCVRAIHLEAVTKNENELRKSFSYRMKRTHCRSGHELKLTRIITPNGGWVCRTCNKEQP